MENQRRHYPPRDLAEWIARQEGAAATEADDSRQQVARRLEALAERMAAEVARPGPADDGGWLDPYVGRVWNCCEYHWRKLAAAEPIGFDKLIRRLEAGDLGYGAGKANLLKEVTLAQALEQREAKAAEMFEHEYMPVVRSVAQRVGGANAFDAVDNFAAELILPRGDRPPRIASFQGRTALAGWLKAVVANFWISQTRKRQAVNLPVLPETPQNGADAAARVDGRPCDDLLRPIFAGATAVLESKERVLLKMLLLDGVGQNELARGLGVASGTLTRRRQRAAERVMDRLRELSACSPSPRQVARCLELALAGDDVELRQRLGEVLAAGVHGAAHVEAPPHEMHGG
ncbi:MAG TPA: hypothetical protein VMV69_28880 [Pirellulales bacterium]|nr:hypothetical protein [Pirellulales bacterium]